MKRMLLLAAVAAVATSACAPPYPVPDKTYLRVEVGDTRKVTVRTRSVSPQPSQIKWNFDTTDPDIALAEGTMSVPFPFDVPITGIEPGFTNLTIDEYPRQTFMRIEVACGDEAPIRAAAADIVGKAGVPVQLEAISPIAHRTTFLWYRGRQGDLTAPIAASGPELAFTPAVGVQYVWVMGATPCSSSTAEFRIDGRAGKQRTVRR